MTDPLILLKRHGKSSKLVGDKIVFSEGLSEPIELPKSTLTRFRKKQNASEHYTLDSLWFCLQSTSLSVPEYIKSAATSGHTVLALTDKNIFDDWISGKISDDKLPQDVVDPLGSGSDMQIDVDVDIAQISTLSAEETFKLILDRERTIHTAKSILIAPSKDFKSLFAIGVAPKPAAAPAQPAPRTHDRYQSRPDLDYYSSMGMGTEDIDTRGSMFLKSTNFPAPRTAPSSSQPSKSDKTRPSSSSTTDSAKKTKTGLKPIIIVPGTTNSPINRFNMAKFFGEGVFEPIDPNDPNLDDSTPHKVEITRKKANGELVPYEIVDNTAKFSSSDWERVIAIFTIGKAWQFKAYQPYKDESRIAEMFKKHCGFYIRIGTEKIPQETVGNWNVRIITVSKSGRHNDAATMQDFWNAIDHFVLTSKINHLKY